MKTFFTIDDPVVPASHPRLLAEVAVAQGADRDEIFVDVGLTYEMLLDPDRRISYGQYLRIIEAGIRLTGNQGLGFDFGAQARLAHWGVVGLAAMNGVDGREALRVTMQYYRTFAPGWDLSIHVEGDIGRLEVRETIPRGKLLPFGVEALLMTMQTLTAELMGHPMPVLEARFGYPRPPYAERYRDFWAKELSFGHEVTEVLFDANTMDTRIEGAEPSMAILAERYCVAEAARVTPTVGLLAEVRKVLVRGLSPRPTLEEVARELRTSSRTLRRALQEMGTSFRTLLDEAARARAEELVRRHSDKLEHVATELGFADVRTFRRAFKRWTGHSPAAFRSRAAR